MSVFGMPLWMDKMDWLETNEMRRLGAGQPFRRVLLLLQTDDSPYSQACNCNMHFSSIRAGVGTGCTTVAALA